MTWGRKAKLEYLGFCFSCDEVNKGDTNATETVVDYVPFASVPLKRPKGEAAGTPYRAMLESVRLTTGTGRARALWKSLSCGFSGREWERPGEHAG